MKVELKNINKSFASNHVLKDVSFQVESGEILALLGENGAGKSTLMNILGGVLPMDSGSIQIDGKTCQFANPSESMDAGIAFIHQELSLINDLAIYENMFLGREIKGKHNLLDAETMIQKTQEIFEKIDLKIDPRTMVRELDASYKQIIEICKAMMMDASIIIMDEPTSTLTIPEIERVFNMMKVLKKQGVGIVFISHKLNEVMEICDTYTVLRDGNMVSSGKISDTSIAELAKYMVGHAVNDEVLDKNFDFGDVVLKGENLSGDGFHNISFSVRQGEVLGVTGLLGDGRTELFQSIFGATNGYTGNLYLDDEIIHITNPKQAIKHGIGYLPRNRKENGIIPDMSILDNGSIVTLEDYEEHGILNHKKQVDEFVKQKESLSIKMGSDSDLITSLSGGNQQKVVLAKWLSANPKVLILDNPTQGVDVGAKEEIYNIILALARQNVAVIVLSSEAQEIKRVCTRTLVMFHGELVGNISHEDMQEHEIMRLATGGKPNMNEMVC